jgi:hypothetical protein
MPFDSFQIAAERAASSYTSEAWFTLSPSEQSTAIYRELRKLDAETVDRSEEAESVPNTKDAHERARKGQTDQLVETAHSG